MSNVENSGTRISQAPVEALRERARKNLENARQRATRSASLGLKDFEWKFNDWDIVDLHPVTLPPQFTMLIPLSLRDEGNALIEETRQLNNEHIGSPFIHLETVLGSDLILIDLCERALQWGEKLCKEVIHKLRRRAKDDPFGTYSKFHAAYVVPLRKLVNSLDSGIVFMVWSSVVDMIPRKLLDFIFIETCGLVINCKENALSGALTSSPHINELIERFDDHGIIEASYVEQIILGPLLSHLKGESPLPPLSVIKDSYYGMLNDIFEAYPYLSFDPDDRVYGFAMPDAKQFGRMMFIGNVGLAHIGFDDRIVINPVDSVSVFGALTLGWDGKLFFYRHPWRTIEDVYGYEDALRLSWWILGQIHASIVTHYLEVEPHYRQRFTQQRASKDVHDAGFAEHTALYVSWVKETQAAAMPETEDTGDASTTGALNHTSIPQIRRNLFFKVLGNCGVRIEQGKGSEIKLLRTGKHPFRLGNHGYVNPTIPSFLAASILRRLEITHDEWMAASNSC